MPAVHLLHRIRGRRHEANVQGLAQDRGCIGRLRAVYLRDQNQATTVAPRRPELGDQPAHRLDLFVQSHFARDREASTHGPVHQG